MAKTLAHITDLHLLDDAEVAQFAAELPGMVASLRVAARAAKESGQALDETFPSITFVPELKDATVIRGDGRRLEVDHQTMQRLDVAQEQTGRVIIKAKEQATARAVSDITQEQLDCALIECANCGRFFTCKVLLAMGANVHASQSNVYLGQTPLQLAAQNGFDDLSRLLLEQGADVNAVDPYNRTPSQLARIAGMSEVADMLKLRELQAAQQSQGSKPAILIHQGDLNKALEEAVRAGKVFLCKMMLDFGADPNPARLNGNSALHIAAQAGMNEMCRLLIERGVDVNIRNKDEQTPLYMAVEKARNKELALMLVSMGADTNRFHGFKNEYLSCANLNFKDMTMHTAAIRLGDLQRMGELLEDPAQPQDADFLKKLASEAKSLKKPEVAAFIQAYEAKARMNAIRASSPKGP